MATQQILTNEQIRLMRKNVEDLKNLGVSASATIPDMLKDVRNLEGGPATWKKAAWFAIGDTYKPWLTIANPMQIDYYNDYRLASIGGSIAVNSLLLDTPDARRITASSLSKDLYDPDWEDLDKLSEDVTKSLIKGTQNQGAELITRIGRQDKRYKGLRLTPRAGACRYCIRTSIDVIESIYFNHFHKNCGCGKRPSF